MRRAYQKGGKVEGSIWHEQDVVPREETIVKADGGPVELPIHPARLIPGAHIREEDYGHPVFTGSRHG